MFAPSSSEPHTSPPGGLRIVQGGDGTTSTIRLKGECDLAHRDAVRQAGSEAIQGRPVDLVLDLSELSFIDSSGIHAVVELAERSTQAKIRLTIVRGPPAVQRVFQVCLLEAGLPFEDGPAG